MIKLQSIVWMLLTGIAGFILFHTSYQVQTLEERLGKINRSIIAEQEAITVLKAEWSYLNNPARIQKLASENLSLQPTAPRQFASLSDIPGKPVPGIVVASVQRGSDGQY